MLHEIQKNTNLAVISVEYRLAPEHPWPAALEDCIDVAEWLLENAENQVRSPFDRWEYFELKIAVQLPLAIHWWRGKCLLNHPACTSTNE
jgi:hypothetical protein